MISLYQSSNAGGSTADMKSALRQKLAIGSPAPSFTLPRVRADGFRSLSDYTGRRLTLVFGSFTCNKFVPHVSQLEQLFQKHKSETDFLIVNVTEAGHRLAGLEFMIEGGSRSQPLLVRRKRIGRALDQRNISIPAVIDLDEKSEVAFQAYPARIVGIDAVGRIDFDLGRPVFEDWNLSEFEQWLERD
jgi:hypothetical protein